MKIQTNHFQYTMELNEKLNFHYCFKPVQPKHLNWNYVVILAHG